MLHRHQCLPTELMGLERMILNKHHRSWLIDVDGMETVVMAQNLHIYLIAKAGAAQIPEEMLTTGVEEFKCFNHTSYRKMKLHERQYFDLLGGASTSQLRHPTSGSHNDSH